MTSQPVIDCSGISLDSKNDILESSLREIGLSIWSAFQERGYAVLKHTGLPEKQKAQKLWNETEKFVQLPEDVKQQVALDISQGKHTGYGAIESNRLGNSDVSSSERVYGNNDIRWTVTYHPESKQVFPQEALEYGHILDDVWKDCAHVALDIARCIGQAKYKDTGFPLNKLEDLQGKRGCGNNLLIAMSPPTDDYDVKESQMRCSAHKDFDLFSLIHQDKSGGLEVKDKDGKWQSPQMDENDILLIPGIVMEIWTKNEITAAVHKVDIPASSQGSKTRFSTIFFTSLDDDAEITVFSEEKEREEIVTSKELFTRKIEGI